MLRAHRLAFLIAAALLCPPRVQVSGGSPLDQGKPAEPASRSITLTGIRLTGDAALPVLELSADAALPEPTVGVLDGPPRVYLDLPGVRPAVAASSGSLGVVTRVRVALHSASPVVTRLVLDLAESRGYTVDDSQRHAGLLRVSITTRATKSDSPRPAPTGPLDARPTPAAQYHARIVPILQQFATVVDVLESIDQRKDVSPDRLEAAAQTIAAVRDELAAVRPARDTAAVHDTLRSACTFASRAVSLARGADGHEIPLPASSAAAGALILLDNARTALQPR